MRCRSSRRAPSSAPTAPAALARLPLSAAGAFPCPQPVPSRGHSLPSPLRHLPVPQFLRETDARGPFADGPCPVGGNAGSQCSPAGGGSSSSLCSRCLFSRVLFFKNFYFSSFSLSLFFPPLPPLLPIVSLPRGQPVNEMLHLHRAK